MWHLKLNEKIQNDRKLLLEHEKALHEVLDERDEVKLENNI